MPVGVCVVVVVVFFVSGMCHESYCCVECVFWFIPDMVYLPEHIICCLDVLYVQDCVPKMFCCPECLISLCVSNVSIWLFVMECFIMCMIGLCD